jgi:xanthine dehydrogenase YagR molybdenum-binding subunit
VEVIVGSQDIGTGTRTVLAQIAAEELRIPTDKVIVRLGDTAEGPYDPVSWGSMTVSSVGPAVRQAARDTYHQIQNIVGDYLGVPSEEIEIKDENIYRRNNSRSPVKLSDIFKDIGDFTILGKGSREPNQTESEIRTFGAQFADVEIDILTGEVNVLKIITVHDFGRVMNPLGSRSQAEGAVIQGIGYGLSEIWQRMRIINPKD